VRSTWYRPPWTRRRERLSMTCGTMTARSWSSCPMIRILKSPFKDCGDASASIRSSSPARFTGSLTASSRRAERDDPPDLSPGSCRPAGARRRAARHVDRPVAMVRVLGIGRGSSARLGARRRHDRNRDPRPARSAHDDREGGLPKPIRRGDATRLPAVPPRVARDFLEGGSRNQRVSRPAPWQPTQIRLAP